MQYILDANAIIALLKDKSSKPAQRVRLQQPGDIGVSSIVAFDLFSGAFKSVRVQQNLALIDDLYFEIINFDKEDARQAGEVRALLAEQGTPIGPYDVLLAGQAIARDLTLVTHNTREFGRVHGLRIEDWED